MGQVDEHIHVGNALDVAREARLELVREVEAARVAGHSFPQICEASGLSVASIQNILRSVSVEKLSLNPFGVTEEVAPGAAPQSVVLSTNRPVDVGTEIH